MRAKLWTKTDENIVVRRVLNNLSSAEMTSTNIKKLIEIDVKHFLDQRIEEKGLDDVFKAVNKYGAKYVVEAVKYKDEEDFLEKFDRINAGYDFKTDLFSDEPTENIVTIKRGFSH